MAGLGRIQQRFNLALVGALAALIGFARGGKGVEAAATDRGSKGFPLARKYVRADPREVRTMYRVDQAGYRYCMGKQERARRLRQLASNTSLHRVVLARA